MEKTLLQKNLGLNLQKARIARNLTREQLAEKAGISPTFLANLECGNKMMSVISLVHLADALCVSIDTLVHGESPEVQTKNIETLLRNQPAAMVQFIEKLVCLSIENAAVVCPKAENCGTKERSDESTE